MSPQPTALIIPQTLFGGYKNFIKSVTSWLLDAGPDSNTWTEMAARALLLSQIRQDGAAVIETQRNENLQGE